MLILSRRDVEAALNISQLIDVLGLAMAELSAGRASMPPRGAASVPGKEAILAAMPAFLPASGALTAKLVSLFPLNQDRPTHQALICCFDPENGSPLAVMDGTYITASRTAAGSALATRLLASPGSKVATIVGTGVQARAHAKAFSSLGLSIRVSGRDATKVRTLVEELSWEGIAVEAVGSVEEAVRSADVVCATTHAAEPVVRRELLKPGTHINSVGYNTSGEGEVDEATIRESLVVVESRSAVLAPPPAGAIELRQAVERGALQQESIVEIGEIISRVAGGRSEPSQLTLYKSVGVAVQDAAAAGLVLQRAIELGIGQEISIQG